jgi:hypothetical protein
MIAHAYTPDSPEATVAGCGGERTLVASLPSDTPARPGVLLSDDIPALHAVWWASRSGAGGMEVRADPQHGTCGAGTTGPRASCGRMPSVKARQAVRIHYILP